MKKTDENIVNNINMSKKAKDEILKIMKENPGLIMNAIKAKFNIGDKIWYVDAGIEELRIFWEKIIAIKTNGIEFIYIDEDDCETKENEFDNAYNPNIQEILNSHHLGFFRFSSFKNAADFFQKLLDEAEKTNDNRNEE